MKLIVGLGNTGQDYAGTRHNAGWLAADWLADKFEAPWRQQKKLDALVAKPAGRELILAKPLTMMNNSGYAVRKLLDYYAIEPENLLLIHDDADLELGDIRRAVASRTGAGHHGVLSVIDHVGPGFSRIRIGIGRPLQPVRDIGGYVLDRLSEEEHKALNLSFDSKLQERLL
jgi:PTH1 family peptidyl-tRNA hydrolase